MVFEHDGHILEHDFQCPYCWQPISMLLEPTAETQTYIEDCEVCCQPIEISYRTEAGELTFFQERATQL